MSELSRQGFKFLILGGINTLLTGFLLSYLSLFMNEYIAYLLAYVCGLFLSFWGSGKWVFKSELHNKAAIVFFTGYLFVFLFGFFVLWIFSTYGFAGPYSGLVVFVTAPLNFLVGRYAFRKRGSGIVSDK